MMVKLNKINLSVIIILFFIACKKDDGMIVSQEYRIFSNEQAVQISGYNGSAMEPFITRNGEYLFFNNSGENDDDMNLHFARKINDLTFDYMGELTGANSTVLEGVPNMDSGGNFYFTTTRSYASNLQSLYGGVFTGDNINNISSIDQNLTRNEPGFLNFDSEVSKDGSTLYFATGKFSVNNFPDEADLFVAYKQNGVFELATDSDNLMKNLNTDILEYAAAISSDDLEIFFNRSNIQTFELTIWQSKRTAKNLSFEMPIQIEAITGIQTEGASISDNGKNLYYHKKQNGVFRIFKVSRE